MELLNRIALVAYKEKNNRILKLVHEYASKTNKQGKPRQEGEPPMSPPSYIYMVLEKHFKNLEA